MKFSRCVAGYFFSGSGCVLGNPFWVKNRRFGGAYSDFGMMGHGTRDRKHGTEKRVVLQCIAENPFSSLPTAPRQFKNRHFLQVIGCVREY